MGHTERKCTLDQAERCFKAWLNWNFDAKVRDWKLKVKTIWSKYINTYVKRYMIKRFKSKKKKKKTKWQKTLVKNQTIEKQIKISGYQN